MPGGIIVNFFNFLNENKFQLQLLYSAKLSFKIDREVKTSVDNAALKKGITTNLALEQAISGMLHRDREATNVKESK